MTRWMSRAMACGAPRRPSTKPGRMARASRSGSTACTDAACRVCPYRGCVSGGAIADARRVELGDGVPGLASAGRAHLGAPPLANRVPPPALDHDRSDEGREGCDREADFHCE